MQFGKTPAKLIKEMSQYGVMPIWQRVKQGHYERLLEKAGFVDVKEARHVLPLMRVEKRANESRQLDSRDRWVKLIDTARQKKRDAAPA
jgi:hypothetical protein